MTLRKKRRAKKYTFAHIVGLSFRYPPYTAFPEGEAGLEAMREAWPALRDECFKLLRGRWVYPLQQIRPRGWWLFESPEPMEDVALDRRAEADQLERMGVELDDAERRYIAWCREHDAEEDKKRREREVKNGAASRAWNLKHFGNPEGPHDGKK